MEKMKETTGKRVMQNIEKWIQRPSPAALLLGINLLLVLPALLPVLSNIDAWDDEGFIQQRRS